MQTSMPAVSLSPGGRRTRVALLYCVVGLSIFASVGCASHPPTTIDPVDAPRLPTSDTPSVDFVVWAYYLNSVDDPSDSQLSTYVQDHLLVRSVVERALAPYGGLPLRMVTSEDEATATYVVDVGVYQYVAWIDILYALLPIPHSSNESICVTAKVMRDGQQVSMHSKCGFSKASGFWAWSGADKPPLDQLREYVTRKVVYQVLSDLQER